MKTITAAIMAKNEALDITDCIESVLWMDEILVLDSGSTDGTQNICRKYPKVKVIETDWPGFGEQSNRAIQMATSDWVFLIDADERVTPELMNEAKEVINSSSDVVAYKTPRLNFFHGRTLKHSANPKGDTPTRLIKKGFAHYEKIVHPSVTVNGKTATLKNYLHHHPYKNLYEMLDKANWYSTLSADMLFSNGKKSNIVKVFTHAFWSFFKIYVLKLGLLDGWIGFLFAFSNLEATFYRYAKLMEHGLSK